MFILTVEKSDRPSYFDFEVGFNSKEDMEKLIIKFGCEYPITDIEMSHEGPILPWPGKSWTAMSYSYREILSFP
jgi:hypothetical protein